MVMKPGASPHWGTNAFDAPRAMRRTRARDLDVFGQIEIVRVALARRLGHAGIAVVGQAGDDRVRLVDAEVVARAPWRRWRRAPRRAGCCEPCALTTASAAAASTSPRVTSYSPDSASRPEISAPILPAPRMRTLCMEYLDWRVVCRNPAELEYVRNYAYPRHYPPGIRRAGPPALRSNSRVTTDIPTARKRGRAAVAPAAAGRVVGNRTLREHLAEAQRGERSCSWAATAPRPSRTASPTRSPRSSRSCCR